MNKSIIKANQTSAVSFAGQSRIHIGLSVQNLNRAEAFYQTLLGTAPTKKRPGYAKFEPESPALNLSISETDRVAPPSQLPSNSTHYGIQVKSTNAVAEAIERLQSAGLRPRIQESTTCCYAVQDKAWVTDPDGNEWEIFVVTEADAAQRNDPDSECCSRSDTNPSCC